MKPLWVSRGILKEIQLQGIGLRWHFRLEDKVGPVVAWAAHARTDRMEDNLLRGQHLCHDASLRLWRLRNPFAALFQSQGERSAVVNLPELTVSRGGQDGEAFSGPYPGKEKRLSVHLVKIVRLLPVPLCPPLKPTIGRDNAAASLPGIAESRLGASGLNPGIDGPDGSGSAILQAPPEPSRRETVGFAADDQGQGAGRQIPRLSAGRCRLRADGEHPGMVARALRLDIAAAHISINEDVRES